MGCRPLKELVAGPEAGKKGLFTVGNGLNVLQQICVNLCLSIGMTMIIVSGGIDLSVGSMLAFSGAVAAGVLTKGFAVPGTDLLVEFTTSGAILIAISVGAVLGWFNGMVITRVKLPPFVATLGMLSVARGLTMLWTVGFPINNLGDEFCHMGTGRLLGVPMPVWIAGFLVVVFMVVMKRTRFGRQVYAVGGNERAATLSGLNVNRIKKLVNMIGGAPYGNQHRPIRRHYRQIRSNGFRVAPARARRKPGLHVLCAWKGVALPFAGKRGSRHHEYEAYCCIIRFIFGFLLESEFIFIGPESC